MDRRCPPRGSAFSIWYGGWVDGDCREPPCCAERISGRARHQIEAANGRIGDLDYRNLAPLLFGFESTPVIESRLLVARRRFTLLGLDLLAPRRLDQAGVATTMDLLIHVVNLRSFGWTMELRLAAGDL